jgi:hypothetical protein
MKEKFNAQSDEFKTRFADLTQRESNIDKEIKDEYKRAKVLSDEVRKNPEKGTEYKSSLDRIVGLYENLDLLHKEFLELFVAQRKNSQDNDKLTTSVIGKQPVAAIEIEAEKN